MERGVAVSRRLCCVGVADDVVVTFAGVRVRGRDSMSSGAGNEVEGAGAGADTSNRIDFLADMRALSVGQRHGETGKK